MCGDEEEVTKYNADIESDLPYEYDPYKPIRWNRYSGMDGKITVTCCRDCLDRSFWEVDA